MTEQHPITPPPETVAKIRRDALHKSDGQLDYELRLIHDAYRTGADQELEACCEWMRQSYQDGFTADLLLQARRPNPPSLKEQALETLHSMRIAPVVINGINVNADVMNKYEIIRRALESMPD